MNAKLTNLLNLLFLRSGDSFGRGRGGGQLIAVASDGADEENNFEVALINTVLSR